MIIIYIDNTFEIKIKEDVLDFIYVIIALIGGGIGISITSKMFGYRRDSRTMKIWVPFIIFVQIIIVIFLLFRFDKWEFD